MVDVDSLENEFQNELSSPAAKKPKVEKSNLDSNSESTFSPSGPVDVGENCCRQYIYDQFSVITYMGEEDWVQLECSSGEKCCRKQPKKKTELEPKLEANSHLDTGQLSPIDENGSHSNSNPSLQKSQSLQLDTPNSKNPIVLKSSLSAGCLVQSHGETSSQTVTTKSVTFNLPPDHVDDRNTLGNGRLKGGVKKHPTEPDDDSNESEENDEATADSDDESSVSASSGSIADPPISKQVGETSTGDGGNVLAPLKTAELQHMAPPSAPSQPIAKYPMNPPPTVPKIPVQHHGAPLGFPPYPDPMQYPAAPGPFGPPMGPPPPHHHLNGAPYLPHQIGPVPIHHVLPQPPNGYMNPPPQHQHHPSFNQNQHYHMPTQPNGYRPGSNVPRNIGQVSNNRYIGESTSRGIYPKGPEFHQHLHSHLHQHMHYPPLANSSPNNLGVSTTVNQTVPITPPVNKTTLIMAAQPKGKWCGLHGKIAFMIHLKKRDKAEEHGKHFPTESNNSSSIYPFPSLQPSRNSSFSVVPNSSNNFQPSSSMCNVPSNIKQPPMESMYPHHPYNPHVPPTLPEPPLEPKREPWCIDSQLGPPPHMIPPGAPPGCHFGTVPVPSQHNPHAPISNYIPPGPPQGAPLPQG